MLKPNFTEARIQAGKVKVRGVSGVDPETGSRRDFDDVMDIRVVLIQGERVEHAPVDSVDPNWTATFDVTDDQGGSPDYHAGEAVAVGVERRRENATVISWTETLPIA